MLSPGSDITGTIHGYRDRRATGNTGVVTQRMHSDELEVDEPVVRRLLAEQFPQWADQSLRRVEAGGTDHIIFRLGDDLSIRLPRFEGLAEPDSKEAAWLPKLAPLLPVDVPVPVAQGRPGYGYPCFWQVHTWVQGEIAPIETIDVFQASRDLCHLIEALHEIDPSGAPNGRGVPVAERDEGMRYWLERFDGYADVATEWERALSAAPWEGPPVWHHGDLDVRNWLIRDGRISGVIDWGSMGVGDPACDLMVAWKLHSPDARDVIREALPSDDATWERARGWMISQAVAILAYYTPLNNPILFHEAENWLALVISER